MSMKSEMKPLKKNVGLTFDEDLVLRLKELADEDERSLSQYINKVLREHVQRVEKKRAEAEERQRDAGKES